MKTTVVDSPNIDHYKIKGKPSAALKDFREMRRYAATANRELPPFGGVIGQATRDYIHARIGRIL